MDISSQSSSAFSDQQMKEKYIKKNIMPIRRGPSGIFGDPVSQSKEMDPHPSCTSQRNSKINADKEEKQKKEPMKKQEENVVQDEKKQEEYERVNNRSEEQWRGNEYESANESYKSVIKIEDPLKYEEVVQNNKDNENPPPRYKLSNQSKQQQKPYHPSLPQQPSYSGLSKSHSKSHHSQQKNLPNQLLEPMLQQVQQNVEEQQPPINQQLFTDSNMNKLRLKSKKFHVIQQASDQSKYIIQILERNTQHLQSIEKRINDQSVILNQFREETSRRLEENVKLALKEKMNEINRENSKQIKDIKNICIILQQLFLQNSKRMDIIQKKVDTLLANPNANPTRFNQ